MDMGGATNPCSTRPNGSQQEVDGFISQSQGPSHIDVNFGPLPIVPIVEEKEAFKTNEETVLLQGNVDERRAVQRGDRTNVGPVEWEPRATASR